MKNPIVIAATILGVVLLILSAVYFMTPAASLPHFLPGYEAGLMKHHIKHGLGALFLGLGCFAYVWFATGKKSAKPQQ